LGTTFDQLHAAIASGAPVGMPGAIGSITSVGQRAAVNQNAAQRPGVSSKQGEDILTAVKQTAENTRWIIPAVEEAGGTF
jgi:hypothetical protein